MENKIALCCLLSALVVLPACKKMSSDTSSTMAGQTLYHCAMHPQIVSDKPGDCPICHMRLTPIINNSTMPSPADAGRVHVSAGIQQEIGVMVSSVTVMELAVPIRAAARVAYDPQLYSASLEHQEAAAFLRKAKEQGSADLIDQAESTVKSSELRLRQMGLSDSQIVDIEQPGYNGSGLLSGSKGGRTWVYASVYDYDATLIHPGQPVELTSPSLPGQRYMGKVRSIDPILNSDTRTLRIRIEIPDADGRLRPETYLSATIQASLGKRLSIPNNAVVDTGTRQLVYVETQPGTYVPRDVQLGHRAGDFYEVLGGLKEGERVVSSANFLIDSESRIQATTQKAIEDTAR